jgi:tetratricopeptide (TPR) repeat protein
MLNYDQAIRHRNEGNDLLALDYFERSALLGPRPATHFEIGRIRERLGEYESAMDAYRAALELAPDYQEARFALLALENSPLLDRSAEDERLRAERIQRARARMSDASRSRRPTSGEVRSLIFPGTEAQGELPSAIQPKYEPTRQLVLGTPAYHMEHGRRFEAQGNWQRAADEYRVALNADPGQLEARLSLGDMMLRLERHARAYAHYAEAIRLFPGSPRPLLKMGNYYDALGRTDLARDYYSQALFLDPRFSEALNNLAALEIRAENYGEAVALLEMAVNAQPEFALPYMNLGIARESSGDRAGALEAYRKYVELGGSRSEEVNVWIAEME